MRKIVLPLLLSLILSACSSSGILNNSRSSATDSAFAMESTPMPSDGCSSAYVSGFDYCILTFSIYNVSDAAKTLTGTIYAEVSGKIFKASTDLGSDPINTVDDSLNPGSEKGLVVAFLVPVNSTITKVFIGVLGTATLSQAIVVAKVNMQATQDNATENDMPKPAPQQTKNNGITCPVNGKCEIGNTGPGGGIVFYVAPTPQSWGQYLEVAPATWNGRSTDPRVPWCDVDVGGDGLLADAVTDPELKKLIGTEIGKGRGNTQLMTAYCKSGAGNLASAYRGGGKSDWFLPSMDELYEIFTRRLTSKGFAPDGYWTSEYSVYIHAWDQDLYPLGKNDNTAFVRPVRAFWGAGVRITTSTPTANPFAATRDEVAARDKKAAGITCPVNGKCEIGNTGPGGGIVFYVAPTPQSWGQYLEVAPATWNGRSTDPKAPWCDVDDVSLVSAVTDPKLKRLIGDEMGKGRGNTQLMSASCKSGAGNLASAYRGGGKSDWFLPSKGELNQLCKYARGQAQSATPCDKTGTLKAGLTTDLYWSSSEDNAREARHQDFRAGGQFSWEKNSRYYVRPVRAFS
jgi:hypothetical protein